MKNHLNILPKQASFDLKCSKMRWRLGLLPRPRWGSLRRSPRPSNRKRQRAFGARHSSFRVHFYISIPLPGPSLTEFLDPPLGPAVNVECKTDQIGHQHVRRLQVAFMRSVPAQVSSGARTNDATNRWRLKRHRCAHIVDIRKRFLTRGPSSKLSSGIQIMSCAIYVGNGMRYHTSCATGPPWVTHPSSPPEIIRTFSADSYIMTSTDTFFYSLILVHDSANYIITNEWINFSSR